MSYPCLAFPLLAQSSRLIKELESKHDALQKQITESETLLKTTKKTVSSQLNGLAVLTGQIEGRRRYILIINEDVEMIDHELSPLGRQLGQLQRNLKDKKRRCGSSVQYLYKDCFIEEKLMLIFSAQSLAQTYRRLRCMREYTTHRRLQDGEILRRQGQVDEKKAELRQVHTVEAGLLKERESEKMKLEKQKKEKRTLVTSLQKKQRGLQNEIAKKRHEADQLNAHIDRLIAEEIEKAHRRAVEEARCEAAVCKKGDTKTNKSATASGTSKIKVVPLETYTMNKAGRESPGSFADNHGKPPIPVSGACTIISHCGQYTVEGLRDVKLDNKGIDIQGGPGAQARAIFNGKVAAILKPNRLLDILIRHGAYISVCYNLSPTLAKQGDTVTTKRAIGQVFFDGADGGRTIPHFRLRQEKEKLNPEPWLNR